MTGSMLSAEYDDYISSPDGSIKFKYYCYSHFTTKQTEASAG